MCAKDSLLKKEETLHALEMRFRLLLPPFERASIAPKPQAGSESQAHLFLNPLDSQ